MGLKKPYWALMNSCLNMRNNKRWSHRSMLINSLKLTRSEIICYSRHPLGQQEVSNGRGACMGLLRGQRSSFFQSRVKILLEEWTQMQMCLGLVPQSVQSQDLQWQKSCWRAEKCTLFDIHTKHVCTLLFWVDKSGQPQDQNSLPDK